MQAYQFQSDVNKLLSLIVHSVYSEKDVFLRELISNSSDAIEKLRFLSLTDHSALNDEPNFFVRIIPDKTSNTLTIWDSGIGMSKEDMITYLGTLARSHTQEFKKTSVDSTDIIGQFGLGFYSSFLVAKTVDVYSKKHDSNTVYKWTSDASNQFTIEESRDDSLKRGTKVVLHLNDDAHEYLETNRLKEIINKHSSFTKYSIELLVTKTKKTTDNTGDNAGENTVDGEVTEITDVSAEPKTEVDVEYSDFEKQNNVTPIWKKDPKDVSEEEYKVFYKSLAQNDDYLTFAHFKVEGVHDFTCLVFVPKRAPFDMFKEGKNELDVSLYVKRVFVSKQIKDIVPEYLNFLKGVVDSEDIPLNISREILQEKNKYIKNINEQITKKIVEKLMDLDSDSYKTFYSQYNKNIKLGVHSDTKNRDKLATLLRYNSVKHQDKQISLKEYVAEMAENQKAIYYITGQQKHDLVNSPFTESLRAKGYDTLLMMEPLDEYVMQSLTKFDGKDMNNITKNDLKLDDTPVDENETHKEFFEYVKKILGNRVNKVVSSKLLSEGTAPCVVSSDGMTANMERIMRSQALQNEMMLQFMKGRKTLELNFNHPLVKRIENDVKDGKSNKYTDNMINILYETAMLSSGYQLDNIQAYSKRVFNMLEMKMELNDLVEVSTEVSEDPVDFGRMGLPDIGDMGDMGDMGDSDGDGDDNENMGDMGDSDDDDGDDGDDDDNENMGDTGNDIGNDDGENH